MAHKHFFWLHIKKSAGQSTRELLQPHYVLTDRSKRPKTFIQAQKEEYNDILNNYRVVLGDYQFRRCLFAKRYLYPDDWDQYFSFAFCREPVDRCLSMFYYLFFIQHKFNRESLFALIKDFARLKRFQNNTSYAFDAFLELTARARQSGSNYRPTGIHFSTHTAPMWEDIADENGRILLTRVFRLEQ